jgi:hypothetical protein
MHFSAGEGLLRFGENFSRVSKLDSPQNGSIATYYCNAYLIDREFCLLWVWLNGMLVLKNCLIGSPFLSGVNCIDRESSCLRLLALTSVAGVTVAWPVSIREDDLAERGEHSLIRLI